jgi:hypothetical protein
VESQAGGAPTPAKPPTPEQGSPPPASDSSRPIGGTPVDLANEWTLETGPGGQVQRVKLPALLADRRAALARCMVEAGRSALVLEVVGGTIRAAKFGAATASCASDLVGKRLPDLGDATVTVRLRK